MSRVLAFVDTEDLRPSAGIYGPEFVREIAGEFSFQKFPTTFVEFDVTKGIEFLNGRVGMRAITKFVIWPNILVIEGQFNSNECKESLGEILQWGKERFKLKYSPEMITHYAYVSDLSFSSTAPLLDVFPLFGKIAERTSEVLSEIWQEPIKYEMFDLKIGHDPLVRKWGIAPFQISRRAEHKFDSGKYFSEAPLPTDEHIALLEEYEAGVLALSEK